MKFSFRILILLSLIFSCRSKIGNDFPLVEEPLSKSGTANRILEIELSGNLERKSLLILNLTSDPFGRKDKSERVEYYNEIYLDGNSLKLIIPGEASYGKIELRNGTWYPLTYHNFSNIRIYLGVERELLWNYQEGYGHESCSFEIMDIYNCPRLWEKGGIDKSIKFQISSDLSLNKILSLVTWIDNIIIFGWTGIPVPWFGFLVTENEIKATFE